MRFLHPVLNGYLAGQAIGDNDADTTLLALPEWDGKTLSLRYLAARGDASTVADIMLKEFELPLYNQVFAVARWLRDAAQRNHLARKSLCEFIGDFAGRGPAAWPTRTGDGSICHQR